jgi:hypothetical protein
VKNNYGIPQGPTMQLSQEITSKKEKEKEIAVMLRATQ